MDDGTKATTTAVQTGMAAQRKLENQRKNQALRQKSQ